MMTYRYDDRDGIIPSLLRGSVEECNFRRYSYCTFIVIPHLEDVIVVLGHVNVLEIIDLTLSLCYHLMVFLWL